MHTIYSLREFYEQAKALGETKGQDYASVQVRFDKHEGLVFSCYVHGYNWYPAHTMAESLAMLRKAMNPIPAAETRDDVEIDMQQP